MNRSLLHGALLALTLLFGLSSVFPGVSFGANVSEATTECLGCHASVTPNVVAAWQKSRHAVMSPQEALQKKGLERKISTEAISADLMGRSVGCAECHTLNASRHDDTFDHEGYKVHVVVTPADCATCHAVEADQYSRNMMSRAHVNLVQNPLYGDLRESINGVQSFENTTLTAHSSDPLTEEDSCLFCHGTAVRVKGTEERETEMGPMEFPVLTGWPNQGSGRLNPDGSMGSCSACHARHRFAIEMARKPYTCSECHKGPDVPAYKVYSVSKHGNIYSSLEEEWNFSSVPWTVGKDFTAPTCASCHISLLVSEEGEVIAERAHQVSNRLPWRIFGVPYAHAHPKSPDTSLIKNKAGLSLPTELTGEPATDFLIDSAEQAERQGRLQKICRACHTGGWVDGHWKRFENTIQTSNDMTLTATRIVLAAWERGIAKGPEQKDSPFNESIEKKWVEQWLFFANSVRFSSAMCGADYGVFEHGRWDLSKNVREMKEWLDVLSSTGK